MIRLAIFTKVDQTESTEKIKPPKVQKIIGLILDYLHQHSPFDRFEGLYLATDEIEGTSEDRPGHRKSESRTGQNLITRLAQDFLGDVRFDLDRHESGQPYGVLNGECVGVSIAHSRSFCLAGINRYGNLGVDLEPVNRRVHPGLSERITSPLDSGCESMEIIRLWTIKEAALKWCGTGLRTAMKSVAVRSLEDPFFKISIENISALLISFQHQQHWMAVAFDHTE